MINDALDLVRVMREDCGDVFKMPEPLRTIEFIHEEVTETWRVAERISNPSKYLRGNNMQGVDLNLKLHLEWGQALMMLLTFAQQVNIDPDLALHLAIQTTYDRSYDERKRLEEHETSS